IPKGTSIRPVWATSPASAKVFVPLLFSEPILVYHSKPREMIFGTLAYVSTLLMLVGLPQRPLVAGNGGRTRGSPRLPSIEAIKAVYSPHTKAPAPMRTSKSKEKSVPRIFLPSKPYSFACLMAILSVLTAIGYSARQYT